MSRMKFGLRNRQKGAAALITTVLLALVLGVVTLNTTNIGMMEQRITGNDLRAREAQEAAEAGLEYATAWAGKKKIPWNGANSLTCTMSGTTTTCGGTTCDGSNCPNLQQVTASTTGETYSLTVTYSRLEPASTLLQINSESRAVVDNAIIASSQAFINPINILAAPARQPPPLVLDGCMTNTGGTPNVYPVWRDLDGDGIKDPGELGPSIITSAAEYGGAGGSFCLDYCGPGGGGGGCSAATVGTGNPHMNLHNGLLGNNVVFPDNSIWKYYFEITPAQFQALASNTLSSAPGLYWLTGTGNWHWGGNMTIGSKTNPAVIVIANGCPKPLGNTVVYGIVFYFESGACAVKNAMNGWGAIKIYGSLGINGGADKIVANVEVHGVGDDDTMMPPMATDPIYAPRIPGTWKDW